jgi:hypothetical protein
MRRFTVLAAASAALLLASGAAQAANVTLNETLDISQPQNGGAFSGWRGFGVFSPSYSFDLAVGDTVDMTVDFVGEQSLTLVNVSTLWLFNFVTAGDAQDVNATGTLQLLDTQGNVILQSNSLTDSEGSAHFGQFFGPGDFAVLPNTITFGGLRYQGTLNAYEANNPDETPGVTSRTYGDPDFAFTADSAVVNGAVPEPATWALMLGGFGLAGAALRRRRARAALA